MLQIDRERKSMLRKYSMLTVGDFKIKGKGKNTTLSNISKIQLKNRRKI
jgi:hypothetical protein